MIDITFVLNNDVGFECIFFNQLLNSVYMNLGDFKELFDNARTCREVTHERQTWRPQPLHISPSTEHSFLLRVLKVDLKVPMSHHYSALLKSAIVVPTSPALNKAVKSEQRENSSQMAQYSRFSQGITTRRIGNYYFRMAPLFHTSLGTGDKILVGLNFGDVPFYKGELQGQLP